MLVHQGAIAFEAWTGRPAPVAHMEEVLRAHLMSRTAGEVSKESKAEE
jgi:shikimate 5-dehydrogenase